MLTAGLPHVCVQLHLPSPHSSLSRGQLSITCMPTQDLAVVVLLMLIPLLAPSETGSAGFSKIAKALGLAAVKVGLPACIQDVEGAAHCSMFHGTLNFLHKSACAPQVVAILRLPC